jgi:hypothetical protein
LSNNEWKEIAWKLRVRRNDLWFEEINKL